MAQLTPLEQVQLDAQRITLKRIQEQKDSKAWQESKDGTVSLDDKPELAVEAKVKTVKTKKG
jgi:hypothetical protein